VLLEQVGNGVFNQFLDCVHSIQRQRVKACPVSASNSMILRFAPGGGLERGMRNPLLLEGCWSNIRVGVAPS